MTDNRTTELREKLTERGVEYEADDHKTYAYTYWGDWAYCEPLDAKPGTLGAQCELMLIPATPEQAIAATLGSETCEIESTRYIESDMPDSWYEFDLSCGHTVKSAQVPPNYCEECGKRIDLQGVSYV